MQINLRGSSYDRVGKGTPSIAWFIFVRTPVTKTNRKKKQFIHTSASYLYFVK